MPFIMYSDIVRRTRPQRTACGAAWGACLLQKKERDNHPPTTIHPSIHPSRPDDRPARALRARRQASCCKVPYPGARWTGTDGRFANVRRLLRTRYPPTTTDTDGYGRTAAPPVDARAPPKYPHLQ